MNRSIEHILTHGITEYGTRNDILLALIRHFASEGCSPEATFTKIKVWLESMDPRSITWQEDPEKVLAGLEYAINRWYTNKRPGVREIQVALTQPDLDEILSNTLRLRDNGRFGARAFRMQQFQFHLIAFFKALGKDKAYLPVNSVKQMNGASAHTASGHLRYCERIGLIILLKSHDRFAHKSRLYRLNYQPQDGEPIGSLEVGLLRRFSMSQLYLAYTWRIYARIRDFSYALQSDGNI